MMNTRRKWLSTAVATLLVAAVCVGPGRAEIITSTGYLDTLDVHSKTDFQNTSAETGYGFNILFTGGTLLRATPTSNVFTMSTPAIGRGKDQVLLSGGGTVAANGSHTVDLKYRLFGGDTSKLSTAFTRQSFLNIPGNSSKPLSLASLIPAINSIPGGSLVTVSLLNNSGDFLTGSVAAYVATNPNDILDSDQFDNVGRTGVTQILSSMSFSSLSDGQILTTFTASLPEGEYLLVTGTIVDNQGGTHTFSDAFTVVPEPSSLALIGTGVVGLLAYGCRRWKVAKRLV
jgi:hypothetical protein